MADVSKILDGGLGIITGLLAGAGATCAKNIGWGTGVTEAAVDDTGLETAAAEARTAGTPSQQTTTTTDDTFRVVAAIECVGAGKAITEIASYTDLLAGTCFARTTFLPINVSVGDSIVFTVDTVLDN